MKPPKPMELADRIVSDVMAVVRPDLAPVRAHLAERLLEADDEHIWPRAERIATDALAERWDAELEGMCVRALADAHELALVQAQRCIEAARDLEKNDADSWIAGAVTHRLAFDVAWDVLTENACEPAEEGCVSVGNE